MDSEEKKVKKTTSKKKTSTKETKGVKKQTAKKTATKTTTKKPKTEKTTLASEKKTVKEVVTSPKETAKVYHKENKVVTEDKSNKTESNELLEIRKKRYMIEFIIVAVLIFIALIFMLNRTFLKTTYSTDAISIDIPRFAYYISDKDNTVKFMTLRKSANLKEYFSEYLEGFSFYSCSGGTITFYYNENTKTLIHSIEIEKKFAIKIIKVVYDTRTPEEVCGIV